MSRFLTAFRFDVILFDVATGPPVWGGSASFSEVTGLEIEIEMQTFREGGYHRGQRQLPGKTSSPTLVLKRGATRDGGFWDWVHACTSGTYPLPYIDGEVLVYEAGEEEVEPRAVYAFTAGVVTKVKHADLDAKGSEVPIEELHIAHEGLERRVR